MYQNIISGVSAYAYIKIGDTELHPNVISSETGVSVMQMLCGDGGYSVGNFGSAQMVASVATSALPSEVVGQKITVYMGYRAGPKRLYPSEALFPFAGLIPLSGNDEDLTALPVGEFYVTPDKMVTKGLFTTLTAFDAAYYATGIYNSTISLPATVEDVVADAMRQAGIPIDENAYAGLRMPSSTPIRVDLSGLSYREVVARCAIYLGANAVLNRFGKLVFIVPGDSAVREYTPETYTYSDYQLQSDASYTIGKVTVEYTHANAEGEEIVDAFEYGESNKALIIQTADIISQAETDALGAAIIGSDGFEYYGYNLKTGGRPEFDLGDKIRLIDDRSRTRDLYILSHTITFNGALRSTYSANVPEDDELYVDGLRRATLTDQMLGLNQSMKLAAAAVNGLQEQMDGKIETYSQGTDPSLGWAADEKITHLGDLWYNPTAKTTKRWSGSAWTELQSSEAEAAKNLASQKAQVFIAQPTVPYYKGDMWVTALDGTGTVKTCITTRTTGSYTASEWLEGLKYTDDTAANAAQNAAEGAQSTAEAAQEAANTALNDIKPIKTRTAVSDDAFEILGPDGVSYAAYGAESRVGAKAGGHTVTSSKGTDVYVGNKVVASYGEVTAFHGDGSNTYLGATGMDMKDDSGYTFFSVQKSGADDLVNEAFTIAYVHYENAPAEVKTFSFNINRSYKDLTSITFDCYDSAGNQADAMEFTGSSITSMATPQGIVFHNGDVAQTGSSIAWSINNKVLTVTVNYARNTGETPYSTASRINVVLEGISNGEAKIEFNGRPLTPIAVHQHVDIKRVDIEVGGRMMDSSVITAPSGYADYTPVGIVGYHISTLLPDGQTVGSYNTYTAFSSLYLTDAVPGSGTVNFIIRQVGNRAVSNCPLSVDVLWQRI